MVKSKKVYAKLIIVGCLLIFVLTGCFLFYIGHSAAASAAEALKSETGISLSGDSRLLYAHSKHDFFGEGTHVFVWQLTEEDFAKTAVWMPLPIPREYREQLEKLNAGQFDGKMELHGSSGWYSIRTGPDSWDGKEAFAGENLTLLVADEGNGKLYMAELQK